MITLAAKRKSTKSSKKAAPRASTQEVPLSRLTAYVLGFGAGINLVLLLTQAEITFVGYDLPSWLYGVGVVVLGYLSYLNWQEGAK